MTTTTAPDDPPPSENAPGAGDSTDGGQLRDGHGRFLRGLGTAEKDALACRLRARGISLREIASRLGYTHPSAAAKAIARALADIPAEDAASLRALECERLDELTRRLFAILDVKYPFLDGGREFTDQNGQPIPDPGPILAVIDRLLRVSVRRSRLLGLDAPAPKRDADKPKHPALELTDRHLELLRELLAGQIEPVNTPAMLALPVVAETRGEPA